MQRYKLTFTAAAALLLAMTLPQAVQAGQVDILALGDSITGDYADPYGYRDELQRILIDRGAQFNFVGTQHDPFGSDPTYHGVTYDNHHEGHSGYRTGDILNGRPGQEADGQLSDWLANYHVDVALIHLGTNDVLKNINTNTYSEDQTVANLEEIVQTIRDFNPGVQIIMAKIIPFGWSRDWYVRHLNARIDGLVNELRQQGVDIASVDAHTGFNTDWLVDGIHPNSLGNQFIAEQFAPLIPQHAPTPAAAGLGLVLLGFTALRRRSR